MGEEAHVAMRRRGWLDWLIVGTATAVIVAFASVARAPQIEARWGPAALLVIAMLVVAAAGGLALWRTTRFS
jgi:hypothetical protein